MGSSAVTLERDANYTGRIQRLNGNVVESLVGAPGGRALRLRLVLSLGDGSVTGRLTGRPVAAEASS